MTKQIEVEFRAQLSKAEYDRIKNLLDANGQLLSEQDQASYYFHDSGKSFKLVHDKDKGSVRMAHKAKTILQGTDFEEFEIVITPDDIQTALPMFKSLLEIDRVVYDEQKRLNYSYNDLEIALKWSEGWGFHIEIEKLVTSQDDVRSAEQAIRKFAKEVGVGLMGIEDIRLLENEIMFKLQNGTYKVAKYV